eukprot:2365237-Rhodomonas_salina.1
MSVPDIPYAATRSTALSLQMSPRSAILLLYPVGCACVMLLLYPCYAVPVPSYCIMLPHTQHAPT